MLIRYLPNYLMPCPKPCIVLALHTESIRYISKCFPLYFTDLFLGLKNLTQIGCDDLPLCPRQNITLF